MLKKGEPFEQPVTIRVSFIFSISSSPTPCPPFLIDTDALFWLFVDLPSAPSLTWRAEKSRNHHFKSELHDCAQFLGKDKKGGQKGDSYGKASLSKLPLWLGGLEQSKLLISWWLKASLQKTPQLVLHVLTNRMWRWWCDELTRFLSLESFGINVIDFGWNYGKPTSHRGLGFNQFPFWSHNDAAISGRTGIKSHKRGDYWKVAATHSVWSKPRKYYLIKNRKKIFDKYHFIRQIYSQRMKTKNCFIAD